MPGIKRAAVIGAGYGGLAAAGLLAKRGWDVSVLEKNSMSGGRAQVWREGGFLFDMGPSWYLMPSAFERIFGLLGTAPEREYELIRLDPSYRVYHDAGRFDVRADLEANRTTFDALEPDGFRKTLKYLARAKEQYDISTSKFLYRDYERLADLLTPAVILPGLKLGLFRSVAGLTARDFSSDLMRKLMGFTMVFIGGSPDRTPGFYALMSHIDLNLNVRYPMGGMQVPALALEKLGRASGARFLFDTPVRKIVAEGGRVRAVRTDGGDIEADLVVANADYVHVERDLLEPGQRSYADRSWERKTVAPSGFILYLGLSKRLPQLLHHNLYFHPDWDRHFGTIFGARRWPEAFSYYVCCPSKTDPSVAPPGSENLFFLVPVAPGLDDPDEVREKFAGRVLAHFESLIGEKIGGSVVVRRIFSHRDFTGAYNAFQGSAFGLAHTLLQTAVFRPAHKSRRVEGLYFTGQYTHPGVGLPMTLISSEVLADRIGGPDA